jgi:hypothetical protein
MGKYEPVLHHTSYYFKMFHNFQIAKISVNNSNIHENYT